MGTEQRDRQEAGRQIDRPNDQLTDGQTDIIIIIIIFYYCPVETFCGSEERKERQLWK